jgi:hypothetical protein
MFAVERIVSKKTPFFKTKSILPFFGCFFISKILFPCSICSKKENFQEIRNHQQSQEDSEVCHCKQCFTSYEYTVRIKRGVFKLPHVNYLTRCKSSDCHNHKECRIVEIYAVHSGTSFLTFQRNILLSFSGHTSMPKEHIACCLLALYIYVRNMQKTCFSETSINFL